MKLRCRADYECLKMTLKIKLDLTKLTDEQRQGALRTQALIWYKCECGKLHRVNRYYVEI